MTLVGTAEIAVTAVDTGAEAEIKNAASGGLADVEAEAITTEGALDDVAVAGRKAGGEIEAGMTDATVGMGAAKDGAKDVETGMLDASTAAETAGGKARDASGQFVSLGGAGTKAGEGAKDLETGVKDAGAEGGKAEGVFGALTGVLGGMSGPMGDVGTKAESTAGGLSKMTSVIPGLEMLAPLLSNPFTLAGIAIVAVGAVLVDFGLHFQDATNKIAAAEGISKSAAAGIGDAFASTMGSTTFGAQEISTAFAGVAAQAKLLNGGALTAAQSLQLMRPAMDLAEASGTSLNSATSDLTKTLVAFGDGIKQSPLVANVLYNAAKDSGVSVDSFTASIDKAAGRMGAAAPPVQQLGGLMVDLNSHALNSRTAMTAMTATISAVIKPSTDLQNAQESLNKATQALPPSMQELAANYKNMTPTEVTAATKGLNEQQQTLWKNFTSSSGAVDTANLAVAKLGFSTTDASGKFIGMNAVIGDLHKQIAGMPEPMAVATLAGEGFGKSAETMYKTIEAGTGTLDKDTAAVGKSNSAHDAAEIATSSLKGQWDKLTAGFEDGADVAGQKVLPVLEDIAKIGLQGIMDFVKSVVNSIGTLFKIFGDIADFIKDIFTGKWGDAWKAIQKIFTDFWDHIMEIFHMLPSNILKALGNMADDVGHFFQHVWDTVSDGVHTAWSAIINFFTNIPHQIEHVFDDVVSAMHNAWSTAANWVSSNFINPIVNFFTAIPGKIKAVWDTAVNDLHAAWSAVANWVSSNVIDPIVNFFTSIPGKVRTVWDTVFNDIKAAWTAIATWVNNNVIQPVVNFFTSLPGKVHDVWSTVVNDLHAAWSAIANWVQSNIVQPVVQFFTGIPGAVRGAWNTLVSDLEGAWNVIANWVNNTIVTPVITAFESIPKLTDHIWGDIRKAISDGLGDVESWFLEHIVLPLVEGFAKIADAAAKGFGWIPGVGSGLKAAASAADAAVSDIQNQINSLKSPAPIVIAVDTSKASAAISGLAQQIAGVAGQAASAGASAVNAAASIPKFYAAGGIVTEPTLAIVGEAGNEAILPLNDPSRMAEILGAIPGSTGGGGGAIGTAATSQGGTVIIQAGAFTVQVNGAADPGVAGAAVSATQQGYSALTNELRAGANPLRERTG